MVSLPSEFFASMAGPLSSDVVQAGTLTLAPSAPTPEPSSIALLATGLLGVIHLTRRRLLDRPGRLLFESECNRNVGRPFRPLETGGIFVGEDVTIKLDVEFVKVS